MSITDMTEEYFTCIYWSEVEGRMVTEFSDVMLKKHYALGKEISLDPTSEHQAWGQEVVDHLTPLMKKRGLAP